MVNPSPKRPCRWPGWQLFSPSSRDRARGTNGCKCINLRHLLPWSPPVRHNPDPRLNGTWQCSQTSKHPFATHADVLDSNGDPERADLGSVIRFPVLNPTRMLECVSFGDAHYVQYGHHNSFSWRLPGPNMVLVLRGKGTSDGWKGQGIADHNMLTCQYSR